MCPVSGTELEESDFKDMSGCVPSPSWASAVRTPVFGQTDVQDKPKRQTIRAYHPELSPSFPALACTSAFAGKEPHSHLQDTSHICWTSCVLMVTHERKLGALLTTLTTFQCLCNCLSLMGDCRLTVVLPLCFRHRNANKKKKVFPWSQLCIFCFWSVFDRQPTETEVRVKHASRWNPDEAVKVAEFLGEKSLMKDSCEGRAELRIVSMWVKRDSAMSLHGLFRCKELAVVENNNWIWND